MKDLFQSLGRDQFIDIADIGVAIFRQAHAFVDDRAIKPLDGPNTFRADERSCLMRLQNARADDGLKERDVAAYEHDIATNLAALRALQKWKKEKGIKLDTPDLTVPAVRNGSGIPLVQKK